MILATLAPLLLVPIGPQSAPASAAPDTLLRRVEPSLDTNERTSVLVLGTPHLASVAGFEPVMLEGLLDVLEAWGPDVICVEALPGRTIAAMLAEGSTYRPVLEQFVGSALEHARSAQRHLEEDQFSAAAILLETGADMRPAERALFALAALETPTALLHWSEARDSNDVEGVPPDIATFLDRELSSANEIVTLGVALGRRLGLTRLDAVDDHMDKDEFMRIAEPLMQALGNSEPFAGATTARVFAEAEEDLRAGVAGGDLLPHYLLLDSDEYGTADVRAQWDVFLRTRLDSGLDRARLALWDVRNLAISANVRRATARVPGGRVLVVIGAAHRPFLNALLGTALDVRTLAIAELVAGDEASGEDR